MIVENKILSSEEYHLNCELKMERKIDQELLWKLCSLPDSSVIFLDLYDENMNVVAQFDNWKSKDFNLFKTECINTNIGVKEPLFWELCLEIYGNDVNICYESDFEGMLTMYMDGTEKEIDNTIKLIGSIDENHIKVVK